MAEIEKLGHKHRVALRIAKDPRFERLPCTHKGTYADDCLVQRVTQHKCYIVATVNGTLGEESGRSLEFPPCTFLIIDTTLSGCQMIMEPLGSNA